MTIVDCDYSANNLYKMIINHKYKFIFLKTRKTASTSLEIALSEFCDDDDIITPLDPEDMLIKQKLGFKKAQNYHFPLRFYDKFDWLRAIRRIKRQQFINHSNAFFVQKHIDQAIWQNYFKFCFERNPFDKAISRYYWSTKEPRPTISDYIQSARVDLLSNWDIYTINDHIAVDFIGRYENLSDDLAKIQQQLKLPKALELPRAKANYRLNHEHYSNVLNKQDRTRIEQVCAKEIVAFAYNWQKEPDQ